MTRDFEYINYNDADRIAILENRAAELERRLLAALPPDGTSAWRNVAMPPGAAGTPADAAPASETYGTDSYNTDAYNTAAYNTDAYPVEELHDGEAGPYADEAGDYAGEAESGEAAIQPEGGADGDATGPAGRTEALINHGRSRARPARSRRILRHWRMIAVGAVALLAGLITALVVVGGGSPGWPASVATVQAQIKQACENPDVAAEPSGLNFACDKDTQPVLWVFSLLTSGNNPGFVDQSTGRKGLEPIQPSQGGDIAWSLNLHSPYNPANPIDSLQVAARAINNIISGATLTSEAALVNDVFQQWMGGTPSRIAQQAGVLFQNADNPGNAQVQAILRSLPASGG
jgi:hypothetical protein